MDILKKMFQSEFDQQQEQDASASNKDEFRKPQWFEEAETDDELFDDDRKFAFQVFTSPLEMQRHFERQLQRLLESVQESEADGGVGGLERNLREDFLKPGFESKILKEFQRQESSLDTDLDGEIYPDQLASLIQRMDPQAGVQDNILRSNQRGRLGRRARLSDEEQIMGRIHGTLSADGGNLLRPARPPASPPNGGGKPSIMTPMTPFGSVFDGSYSGPKMFSQSVMTKTVRKPDGSYETTKVTQDSSGQKTTTVTRMVNGRQETVVTKDGGAVGVGVGVGAGTSAAGVGVANRNIYVTKEGYAMPRNLW